MTESGTNYDSYESATVGLLVQMVSMSPTFQDLVGVLSQPSPATLALGFIVEVDGGDDIDNACSIQRKTGKVTVTASPGTQFTYKIPCQQAFALIQLDDCEHVAITPDTYIHHGSYTIIVVIPFVADEAPPNRMRRARNIQGLIRVDFLAQRGQPGALWRCDASCETPTIPDDTGPFRQTVHAVIKGTWSAP